ncbi:MAG: glycosyltransferase [Verrucomicrobiota bacterium]
MIFNPGTEGGIPVYGHFQARAFGELGWLVIELCDRSAGFKPWPLVELQKLLSPDVKSGIEGRVARGALARMRRVTGLSYRLLLNQLKLLVVMIRRCPDVVLLASYSEYLAPFWSPALFVVSKVCGIPVMACLHDPVRDYKIGPDWWHALSVRMAYSPLSAVFVHDPLPLEACVPPHVRSAVVPHGLFELGPEWRSTGAIREEWEVPEGAIVFLSLGFIRDGKNLDLMIRSMVHVPDAYLVIMGRVQSASSNRPLCFYRQLAEDLGVSHRIRFREAFVPEEALTSYFAAADVIVMTYSRDFRSQSGVLNVAAHAAKPLLVSCGGGPLESCVLRFQLGIFVRPDDQDALDQGALDAFSLARRQRDGASLEESDPKLDWSSYREFASWATNARIIEETYESLTGSQAPGADLKPGASVNP